MIMDIKKEKSKSFWAGFLTGAASIGLLITICAVGAILGQARLYSSVAGNNPFGNELSEFFGHTLPQQQTQQSSSVDGGKLITDDIVKKSDEIYDIIEQAFLFEDDIDRDKIEEAIYDGIFSALGDKYSVYYTKEEFADYLSESEGIYYGIGAYVQIDDATKYPLLTEVFEGSPAEKAGLRSGDIIVAADGTDLNGMELSAAVALIKGPENTDVVLTVHREGVENFDVTATRGKVVVPTVTHEMLENNIGYIKLREFDDITYSQYCEAYQDLKDQGMTSLIIDLRNNPGGNLSTVVDICGEIVPAGVITYTVDKYGNREDFKSDGKNEIDIPLVVLVNGYSASASELMTGAIRDYNKGTIIGTNTFGKGIVQRLLYLSDESGIKITTERYYTPNGECIHGVGIKPDIEIEFDSDLYYSDAAIDNQLQKAIDYLNGK